MLENLHTFLMKTGSKHIAYIYHCAERYSEAAEMYEKAANICIFFGQNRAAFRVHRSMVRLYCKTGLFPKAISICRTEINYQRECEDRKFIFSAKILLGDVLFSAQKYEEALKLWKSLDSVISDSLLRRISRGYEALGDNEKSHEYLDNTAQALCGVALIYIEISIQSY